MNDQVSIEKVVALLNDLATRTDRDYLRHHKDGQIKLAHENDGQRMAYRMLKNILEHERVHPGYVESLTNDQI